MQLVIANRKRKPWGDFPRLLPLPFPFFYWNQGRSSQPYFVFRCCAKLARLKKEKIRFVYTIIELGKHVSTMSEHTRSFFWDGWVAWEKSHVMLTEYTIVIHHYISLLWYIILNKALSAGLQDRGRCLMWTGKSKRQESAQGIMFLI